MKSVPTFEFENEASGIAAGCDEAGRGPLAGPVVAAAVIFNADPPVCGGRLCRGAEGAGPPVITDSKQMTKGQRGRAFEWITANCVWAVGECSPAEIDEINILRAAMLAMRRAVAALPIRPDFVLVDGNRMPDGINGRAIVKGDAKSVSIAAASIVAKVWRDRIMTGLAAEFPGYGWDKNAGYPTRGHYAAIAKLGVSPWHRKSFRLG